MYHVIRESCYQLLVSRTHSGILANSSHRCASRPETWIEQPWPKAWVYKDLGITRDINPSSQVVRLSANHCRRLRLRCPEHNKKKYNAWNMQLSRWRVKKSKATLTGPSSYVGIGGLAGWLVAIGSSCQATTG